MNSGSGPLLINQLKLQTSQDNYFVITDYSGIDHEKWTALLDRSAFANPFQSAGFYTFYAGKEGMEPFAVIAGKGEEYLGVAVGVIYKEKGLSSYFSRRAILEGGIVLEGNDQETITELLLNALTESLSKRVIYLEIRNYQDYGNLKPVFEKHGFDYLPYLNFQVDCSDPEKMKGLVNKGKMRQISSSLKEGAQIIVAESENQVREFYDILLNLYREKVKKPLPPWAFFRDFLNSGLGIYLLVSYKEKIVGGIMCPYDKNAIYEWYIAGLDNRSDKVYPSILATWAAMDHAGKNNIPRFDFMGAGQPDKDYGVREFKSRFGGGLVEHGRFRKIYQPQLFKIGLTGLKILSKIK